MRKLILLKKKIYSDKKIFVIVIFCFLIGVVIGNYSAFERYEKISMEVTSSGRYAIYALYFVFLIAMSECMIGAPFILYFIYIYGINLGTVLNLLFNRLHLSNFYISNSVIVIILSFITALLIGVSSIKNSISLIKYVFSYKNNRMKKQIFSNTLLILTGLIFMYFSDYFKIIMLSKIN